MPMLEVKNIKKNFGDTEVLKGLDFSLEKGEAGHNRLLRFGQDYAFKVSELP